MLTPMRSIYNALATFLVFLMISLTPGTLYAQSINTIPPGGAALLSLPGQGGENTTIESYEAPKTLPYAITLFDPIGADGKQ